MNKESKLLFLFCLTGLYFLIATGVALPQKWDINLFPGSYPSKSTLKIGDIVKIDFAGYNNDRRPMYRTHLEILLPEVVDYIHVKNEMEPPTDVELKRDSVRWNNVEQHVKGLSKGDALKRPKGWWCTIKKARSIKPGTGDVTAKLTWEDKGGKKYERNFLLKTVVVTGIPEERPDRSPPETQTKLNQAPEVRIVIFPPLPGKARFYIDADDPKNDQIEIQWKIDEEDWSDWMNPDVIKKYNLAPGKHKISAKVRKKGNTEESKVKTREFTIPKNQPPVFEIDGPYKPIPNIVSFHFTGKDPEGDNFKYIYEVKDKSGEIIRPEESVSGPMNIVFLSLASGTYTIKVLAKDDNDKQSEAEESEFTIENQGPVVTISEPSYQDDGSVQFTFSATDPEGDAISQYNYKVKKDGETIREDSVSGPKIKIDNLPSGTYSITVQAEDDKANQSEPAECKFTVENQGLVVTISEPLYGDDGSVEFHLSAVDREGNAIATAKYDYKIDAENWQPLGDEHIIRTNSLQPGEYRLFARAKDDKGNTGKIEERKFKISEPVSLSITRGEIAPWGKDIGDLYGIGWGYEIRATRHLTPSWSSSLSLGFQKYETSQKDRSLQIIPFYVRGTYSLLKTSNRRFQLKSFFGLGPVFYKFDPSQTYGEPPYDYEDATALGTEIGLIMDFAILPPTSPNNVSFILQGGINYTYQSDFQSMFTSLMLGMKYKF